MSASMVLASFLFDKKSENLKQNNKMNSKVEEMKSETLNETQINENNEETVQVENAEAATDENKEEEAPAEPTLEEQLEAAKNQIEELKKDALYKAAEFDNFRKRMMKEKADLVKYGGEKVMKSILPIIDDFERADQMMGQAQDVEAVKEGVKLIIEKFMKQLGSEGLQKIDCVGKEFDTDYHEAVAMVPGQPEDMKNKVMDCIQTGYMMHEKVIRHSKVAVAQ